MTSGYSHLTSPVPHTAAGFLRATTTIAGIDETNKILAYPRRFEFGVPYRVMILPLLLPEFDVKLTTLEIFEGPRLTARGSVHVIIDVDFKVIHRNLDEIEDTRPRKNPNDATEDSSES